MVSQNGTPQILECTFEPGWQGVCLHAIFAPKGVAESPLSPLKLNLIPKFSFFGINMFLARCDPNDASRPCYSTLEITINFRNSVFGVLHQVCDRGLRMIPWRIVSTASTSVLVGVLHLWLLTSHHFGQGQLLTSFSSPCHVSFATSIRFKLCRKLDALCFLFMSW